MNPRRALCHAFASLIAACTPVVRYDATSAVLLRTADERRGDRIVAAELRGASGWTAFDAVRQLRPEFLRSESPRTFGSGPTPPSVYLDGRHVGGLEVLATISLDPVIEIRRLASGAAKNMFGSYCKCDGGVILVRTRAEP